MKKAAYLKTICTLAILAILITGLCGCSGMSKALHTSYTDTKQDSAESNYGKGNYVYDTVTFTGDAMKKETVLSVKELEDKARDDDALGYQKTYSFLTRGSIFSTHEMAGIKLYDLLVSLGMDKELPDKTQVTAISRDGYTTALTLGDLRSGQYGMYSGAGDTEPKESGLPVLLGFGSDDLPLVGPTGSEKPGKKFSEEEGYDEKADNVGGPVRLIIGQTAANDYNAPKNGKWITSIIVGEQKDYALHDAVTSQETALTVSLYDSKKENKLISSSDYTFADLESSQKNIEKNYYSEKGFYEGVNLWDFLTKQVGITSQEGNVKFLYEDGSYETVSLEYIRNMGGDFEDYTVKKEGLTITCVKPALGYSKDGKPSNGQVFALLPAKKGVLETSTAKPCKSMEVTTDGSGISGKNPYKNRRVAITGSGVKKTAGYTIAQLEKDIDLQVKSKDGYSGVSLSGLLEKSGLTVDADKIVVKGSGGKVSYTLKELKQNKEVVLATRKDGKALASGQGPLCLTGNKTLKNVTEVEVKIKSGQWKHNKAPYNEYLNNTLTITGPEAKGKKTYTLKELEQLNGNYIVKDSFGASGGTNGYEGVILKAIINENLKSGVKKPSKITIVGKDGYKTALSVTDVYKGIESKYQKGQHRDVILAYSIDGVPMVSDQDSEGYTGNNAFGPLKLIVENQISKWVKNVTEIRLGE